MATNIIMYNESMHKGYKMSEISYHFITKTVLFVASFLMWFWAQVTDSYQQGYYEESLKYGLAVMFLSIVVFMLYKEWKKESQYAKKLNEKNDKIIDDYRTAFERNTAHQAKLTDMLERHDKNASERTQELIKAIQELK